MNQEILDRFRKGLDAAREAGITEPTAMILSTVAGDGVDARTVLLKQFDERGFVFYTNTKSAKGRQIASNPNASLTFLWAPNAQQVRMTGRMEKVSDETADAYFAGRPRGSQIGAWASRQSEPLDSREQLEARVAAIEGRFSGREVPRPEFWSGYRLVPEWIEFWYGRQSRLHDRIRFDADTDGWRQSRLYP